MTEQKKTELIEKCRKDISQMQSWHDADDYSSDIKIFEIALASLTAPPVKLPPKSDVKMGGDVKTRSLLTGMNMMQKSCAEAIRAAGYEVEE